MKINLCGTIFNNSGYSRHTRSLANALNEAGCDVRLDVQKIEQWERQVNDFELQALSKPFDPESTTIFISQPQFWPLVLAEKPKHFVGYLVWEGDKIPEYWCDYLIDDRIDMILVPSTHTYNAVLKTIESFFSRTDNLTLIQISNNTDHLNKLIDKIKRVPEGYDPSSFYPDDDSHDTFTFVANKGWSQGLNDRGGIQYLLQAFAEEFNEDEDVSLKIKLNATYNIPGWDLAREIDSLNLPKDRPKIFTCNNNMTDKELRAFYNEGNVFVTTSMAEGFNLPALEALGCGLPVLTTHYGGQADFINEENGWLINEGEYDYYSKEISYEEVKWFKPSIKQIRKKLRYIYNNQDEVVNKHKKIITEPNLLTWLDSAKKIKELIAEFD